MTEQAIRHGDESIAPGLHIGQQTLEQVGALNNVGGEESPERRITADSFRLLTARLRKKPVAASAVAPAAINIPDLWPIEVAVESPVVEPVAVQEELASAPIEAEHVVKVEVEVEAKPAFPTFDDLPVETQAITPEIEEVAEPEILAPVEEVIEADIVAAEPVQVEDLVLSAEPVPEAVDIKEDFEPQEIVVETDPVAEIEVQGIGEIAKAIYMTPTPTDRAEFLAECAAMAAAEAEAEQARGETPTYSEQFPSLKHRARRVEPADDPFAKVSQSGESPTENAIATDEDSGELARSLLDMMLSSPNSGLPQERALASDALLKLVPRIPLRALVSIVERVSIMETPPHLLVSKLINDPRIEVAGPLLEHCNHISDQVLSKVVATGQVSLQRLIARRRHISAALADQLIQFDDPSVVLTLVRNGGVTLSHNAFTLLADHVVRHHAALAPFATRSDLPAPIAFELYWFVPAELRRYLLSRFLTDSETLTKILKITQTMQVADGTGETKFPEHEQIEEVVALLADGKLPEASEKLAEIAGIQIETATRIANDREGEPMAIVFKAMGTNRARFGEIVELFKNSDFGIISGEREVEELQNVFDAMSFNKARILLTYWDWSTLKSGPYAPAN
jgi:Uncharacterised protein conserved in bacteria (DUF2336)